MQVLSVVGALVIHPAFSPDNDDGIVRAAQSLYGVLFPLRMDGAGTCLIFRSLSVRILTACVVALLFVVANGCDPSHPDTAPAPPLKINFAYGSEKREWIEEAVARFNESRFLTTSGQRIFVDAIPMGSGELVQELLDGSRQVHIVSPASSTFVEIANARGQDAGYGSIIGATQSLVRSPLVIAIWQPMAEALGWPDKPIGWSDIAAIAGEPGGWAAVGKPDWGRLRLSHTHPEYSNSGLMTLAALAYATSGKTSDLSTDDLSSLQLLKTMEQIESSAPYYGVSSGFFADQMVRRGPRHLHAAVVYESAVIGARSQSADGSPPMIAIYPKEGTFISDNPIGLVQREWVKPAHREAGKTLIEFLTSASVQELAVRHGFHAVNLPTPTTSATVEHVQRELPAVTFAPPSVDASNKLVEVWRQAKLPARIAFVFDTSGSMLEQDRLPNAKRGALEMIKRMSPRDRVSLLPFAAEVAWAARGVTPDEQGIHSLSQTIDTLPATGGTRLYDALDEARRQFDGSSAAPSMINAILVLTDGADTDSTLQLDQLIQRLTNSSQPIRVFTIGYGTGVQDDVLRRIAEKTGGKHYSATPATIEQVFRDIVTFF